MLLKSNGQFVSRALLTMREHSVDSNKREKEARDLASLRICGQSDADSSSFISFITKK